MKASWFFKSKNLLRLRAGVGVGENVSTPTPTPGKTTDSGRLRLRLRSPGHTNFEIGVAVATPAIPHSPPMLMSHGGGAAD